MTMKFNADEIFEMAEQIERNGARFYRSAADQTAEEGTKEMLLELCEWEHEHEETFHEMRGKLSPGQGADLSYDPTGEAALYLQAFADGYVFDVEEDPTERIGKEASTEDVLRVGLGLEKDSIVFYVGIKELVPEGDGRDKVDEIIREEMRHVRILNDLLVE